MVTATTTRVRFTYEDYLNTPEDKRYELLDGELIMVSSPNIQHQRAERELAFQVIGFVKRHDLGEVFFAPTDVILSDTDVVQPDLLFVSRERAHIIASNAIYGAPDLVVEILSPSTARRDLTFKRRLYAKHGVKEYWQVNIDDRSVTVLSLGNGDYEVAAVYGSGDTLASPVLPGFALVIDEIF